MAGAAVFPAREGSGCGRGRVVAGGEVAADGALSDSEPRADADGGHGGVAIMEPGDRSRGACPARPA